MTHDPRQFEQEAARVARRQFLGHTSLGLGFAALGGLSSLPFGRATANEAPPAAPAMAALPPVAAHFAAKAKRVIFLCMAGGPSHLETFDFKPVLRDLSGKPMPASVTAGQPIAQLQGKALLALGAQTRFRRWGKKIGRASCRERVCQYV